MRSSLLVAATMLFVANTAAASTDINGLFDARSMGMGSTGIAFLDSAGVMPINPAALDQIDSVALTLDAYLIFAQPQAPYVVTHADGTGRQFSNWETMRSKTTGAVLPFIGGAFRLHERIVLGAGIYPMIGQGTSAEYKPAPELRPDLVVTNEAAAGLVELGVPVAIKLLDNLSLGLMWRGTYNTQTITTALPGAGVGNLLIGRDGQPIYGDINVSGIDVTGFQVGLLYKPTRWLGLGFSFRNKVQVDAEGTTKSKNPINGEPLELETIQPFSAPHNFRVGAAITGLQDALTIAAEFKYLMYAEAWKVIDVTTTRNGVSNTTSTPANWKDAFNVYVGGEYKAFSSIALRAGYILATSATPDAYAKQFMAPPGISHCFTGGFGVKVIDELAIDVAYAYVVLSSEVEVATPDNSGIGTHASHGLELAASLTYRN